MSMFFSYLLFIPIMSISCLLMFITQRRYLLMCLLCLECLILSMIFIIMLFMSFKVLYLMMIILAIAACEASLGLSMVVIMTRYIGNDKIYMLKFFKC